MGTGRFSPLNVEPRDPHPPPHRPATRLLGTRCPPAGSRSPGRVPSAPLCTHLPGPLPLGPLRPVWQHPKHPWHRLCPVNISERITGRGLGQLSVEGVQAASATQSFGFPPRTVSIQGQWAGSRPLHPIPPSPHEKRGRGVAGGRASADLLATCILAGHRVSERRPLEPAARVPPRLCYSLSDPPPGTSPLCASVSPSDSGGNDSATCFTGLSWKQASLRPSHI